MKLPPIGTFEFGDIKADILPATVRQVRELRNAEDSEAAILKLASEVSGLSEDILLDLPSSAVNAIAVASLDSDGKGTSDFFTVRQKSAN